MILIKDILLFVIDTIKINGGNTMKRRLLIGIIVLSLLVVMITGCVPKEETPASTETPVAESPAEEKVLIVRATGDSMSFNPDTLADDNAYPIVQNIFNRLVKLDASKQIVPDLATEWNVSDDGTVISFKLREDAKWHDGEPLTSEDVKYTFDTIKANTSYYFSTRLAIVDSIDTPDEYTVMFNMNKADVSFIADLGWYATFILPKHIYNNGQAWEDNLASKNPIGSGPFKFSEYKQGESTTIVANPDYHAGAPKLNKIIFSIIPDEATAVQALLNGEIDVFEAVPTANVEEIEANGNIRLALNEYPSPMRILFNLKNKKVEDLEVRKAIATAINREEISEKIFNGVQKSEYSFYPSLIEWASNSKDIAPAFNIEAAKKILEDAGYTQDANGYYITGITIDVFEGFGYPDTAKLMEATLKQAGIELIVQVHEYNAWSEKVSQQRDFILETILSNYQEDATMIISTHLISDIEKVFDEVILLQNGSVYDYDSVDSIREKTGKSVDELFREVFRC